MIRQYTKKTVIPLIITFIIATSLFTGTSSSISPYPIVSSQLISTSGTISYHLVPSDTLPLTGVGGDYLLFSDNGSPNWWLQWGSYWLNQVAERETNGYDTVRLGFWFSGATSNPNGQGISVLDYAKFNTVLAYMDSINVKVVALCQNWIDSYSTEAYGYTMSQHLWDNWLDFVQYYKGDKRIAAVSLFGETDAHNIGISKQTPANRLAQTKYYADLTRAIHQIDSARIVVFPIGQLYYASQQDWINDLKVTRITDEPNVVFDIVHPYFFENDYDMGLSPEQKAAWYTDAYITPAVNALGAYRCWAGETFAWYPGNSYSTSIVPSHPMHLDLQQRWLTSIINCCVANGVGFDIWAILGQDTYPYNVQAMDASNYVN